MNSISIKITGGGWFTVSGPGRVNQGDRFAMPQGTLAPLHKELYSSKPDSRWGRLDRYSKLGLIGAAQAVEDAGSAAGLDWAKTAVVVSTLTGSMEVDHSYYETVLPQSGLLASPNLFAYTLPNCMLGEISIRYGLTGPLMIVNQAHSDMLAGIVCGAKCLYSGLVDTVLAGYCNVEFGLDQIQTPFRPGAVFLIMQKSQKPSPVTFNGTDFYYGNHRITHLIECMEMITDNQNTGNRNEN